ncbi:MAG: TlpA family protein disulfide reductase, partial [Gemmatimonadetes bacterium]|nr:TlpA family protein disulfide reductase [Gemmatimonadota bacterium]
PYIVAFWTSWCGPCGDAMPVLTELGENGIADHDVPIAPVRILHMTADRDPWSARAFATRNALPPEDVLFLSSDPDRQEAFAEALSLASLPLFLLVDADGNVAYRTDGYDGNAFAFETTLGEWLKEAF